MRYYTYLAGGILVTSAVLIGVGAGLGMSALIIGGVLCLIIGGVVGFFSGVEQRR